MKPAPFQQHALSPDAIRIGSIEIRYLIDGSGAGHAGLFEMKLPPQGNVPPAHSHVDAEEVLYVLEGRLRHSIDGVERDLGPGDCAFTPKGAVHGFSNPFTETVRTLTVLTPDIGAAYFREVGAVVNAGGPPDRVRLMAVMARYGLRPGGPETSPRPASPPA
jgi:quercetin dioxygenase-like cupin family protein